MFKNQKQCSDHVYQSTINTVPLHPRDTLKKHVENYRSSFSKVTKGVGKKMYPNYLATGQNTLDEVKQIKKKSVLLFDKRGFWFTFVDFECVRARE